jgi:hypothetical protein
MLSAPDLSVPVVSEVFGELCSAGDWLVLYV